MTLATDFFKQPASLPPVSFEMTDEGPIVRIHNPYDPQVFEIVAGTLAAMDALTSGADGVTEAMIDKAESAARNILSAAIKQLDNGAWQSVIAVEFDVPDDNEV
jgi:hypothetical protein